MYRLAHTLTVPAFEFDGLVAAVRTNQITLSSPPGSMIYLLRIEKGFQWDGASGPAIDTDNFMLASCAHDALYYLLRMGLLLPSDRVKADKILFRLCRQEGMSWIRAKMAYVAVRLFGRAAAKPAKRKFFT